MRYANTYRETIFLYAYICQATYTGAHERRQADDIGRGVQGFADPTRLRILGLLAGGEICVCNIHECLGIPQPTASRHLAYLRRKNLVETRKDGLWVHYKLAALDEPVMRVLMSAVTHVLSHCDAIGKDRERLEAQTGCCVPTEPAHLECCPPRRRRRTCGRKVP